MHNEPIQPQQPRQSISLSRPTSVQVDRIYQGGVFALLQAVPDNCRDMVMTSPPFWQLRDYGVEGQLGLEPTIEEYLAKLLAIFDQVPGVVCDPCVGSGTTAVVAQRLTRHSLGFELNPAFVRMATQRLAQVSLWTAGHEARHERVVQAVSPEQLSLLPETAREEKDG